MTTHHPRTRRPAPGALPGLEWIRRNKLTAGIIGGALAVILVAVIVIAAGSGASSGAAPPSKAPSKTPAKAPATTGRSGSTRRPTGTSTRSMPP